MQEYLPTILTTLIVILGMFGIFVFVKKALKEITEFFVDLTSALEDNKITKEEMDILKQDFQEILNSFK